MDLKPENTANPDDLNRALPLRPDGACPCCGKGMLRDGFALLTRVVVIGTLNSTAKCSQCKAWVKVPLVRAPVDVNVTR